MLRLAFLFSAVLLVLAAGEPQILDSETYPALTASGKWLVKFYAPWCTHCQKMEPVWNELSEKFESEKSPFQVAKVDCTQAKDVCEKAGVKGFPTIMYVSSDTRIVFKGSRTLDDFVTFSKRVTENPIHVVMSAEELDTLKNKPEAKFYLLVLSGEESEQVNAARRELFESLGRQMVLESQFYLTSTSDSDLKPGIYSFKDKEATGYHGEATPAALLTWAKREKYPRFFQLTRETANDLEEPLVCMAVIKPDADNSVLFAVVDHLAKVGNNGEAWPCRFVWMDATGEWKSFVESRFQYYSDDLPRFVVYSVRTATYFEHPSTELPTIESATAFLQSVAAGTAEAKGGRGLLQDIKSYFSWLGNFISVSLSSAYEEYPHIMQLSGATVLFCVIVFVRNLFRPKQAVRDKAE